MKTLEFIKANYKSGCMDSRDLDRLMPFFPASDMAHFGFDLVPGAVHNPVPFTRDNVLIQLEKDVSFGFEKALNQRGLSSFMMYEVVRMWNWILEEGLEQSSEYAQYGLPLFKATAVKYGFPNPIGNDSGSESKYGS